MGNAKPIYKRVLLKISGEALAGDQKQGLNFDTVLDVCKSIKKCNDAGVEVAVVVGGGNFWRGRAGGDMDRTRADHMECLPLPSTVLPLQMLLNKQVQYPVFKPLSQCNR